MEFADQGCRQAARNPQQFPRLIGCSRGRLSHEIAPIMRRFGVVAANLSAYGKSRVNDDSKPLSAKVSIVEAEM